MLAFFLIAVKKSHILSNGLLTFDERYELCATLSYQWNFFGILRTSKKYSLNPRVYTCGQCYVNENSEEIESYLNCPYLNCFFFKVLRISKQCIST